MSTYRIAVVVGSLRKDSFNRALATALARLGPAEFSFEQVEIGRKAAEKGVREAFASDSEVNVPTLDVKLRVISKFDQFLQEHVPIYHGSLRDDRAAM